MNRRYDLLAALLSLMATLGVSAQTNTLTLDGAMQMAMENSPSLEIAGARLAQAVARSTQVGAAYWPSVHVPASFSRQAYPDTSTIALLSRQDSVEYYRLGLSASWTLFDGFARRNQRLSADQAEQQSEAALADSARMLLGGVAAAYHAAQLAQENLRIALADEAFNQNLLEEAELRVKAGAGSREDKLNFEVRRNAASSEVLRQRESVSSALASLADVIGLQDAALPSGTVLAGLAEASSFEMGLPETTQMVAVAGTRRPDLAAARLGVDRSESDAATAKAQRWPIMAVSGSLDGERQEDPSFESGDFGNTVGLSLNYPFIDGGQRRGRISEARALVDESVAVARALEISVAAEIRQAIAALEGAQQRLALQQRNAVTVQENRDLTEKAYRAGKQSLVRLNEAQRDLIAAEGQLALAKVALQQARVRLSVATGEILDRAAPRP